MLRLHAAAQLPGAAAEEVPRAMAELLCEQAPLARALAVTLALTLTLTLTLTLALTFTLTLTLTLTLRYY